MSLRTNWLLLSLISPIFQPGPAAAQDGAPEAEAEPGGQGPGQPAIAAEVRSGSSVYTVSIVCSPPSLSSLLSLLFVFGETFTTSSAPGERGSWLKTKTVIFIAENPAPPLFCVREKQTKERDRTLHSSAIGMRLPLTRRCPSTTPSQTSGGRSSSWGPPVSAVTSSGRGCWTTPASSRLPFPVSCRVSTLWTEFQILQMTREQIGYSIPSGNPALFLSYWFRHISAQGEWGD